MPQVRFTAAALRDIERLREFLRPKSPDAAGRAARAIIETLHVLARHPRMSRLVEAPGAGAELRELMIFFGDSGYIARYHFDGSDITILALQARKGGGRVE